MRLPIVVVVIGYKMWCCLVTAFWFWVQGENVTDSAFER